MALNGFAPLWSYLAKVQAVNSATGEPLESWQRSGSPLEFQR